MLGRLEDVLERHFSNSVLRLLRTVSLKPTVNEGTNGTIIVKSVFHSTRRKMIAALMTKKTPAIVSVQGTERLCTPQKVF